MMEPAFGFFRLWFIFSCFLIHFCPWTAVAAAKEATTVTPASFSVGQIMELAADFYGSCIFIAADFYGSCIFIPADNCYSVKDQKQTRIVLPTLNSKLETASVFAAVDMLKGAEVEVTSGPRNSTLMASIAELGNKATIPVISLFATSPVLFRSEIPSFIRVTNETYQLEAIIGSWA